MFLSGRNFGWLSDDNKLKRASSQNGRFAFDHMIRKLSLVSSWASLTFVAAATLSSLVLRPHLFEVRIEHVGAFAVIGLLFCLAYPRQTVLVCAVVLGSAALLEALQLLTPDRHGQMSDLLFKLAGGASGIVAGKVAARLKGSGCSAP
jgi:hypothetical protein